MESFRDWKRKNWRQKEMKLKLKRTQYRNEDLKEVAMRHKNDTEARCKRIGIYCETTLKEMEDAYLKTLKDIVGIYPYLVSWAGLNP